MCCLEQGGGSPSTAPYPGANISETNEASKRTSCRKAHHPQYTAEDCRHLSQSHTGCDGTLIHLASFADDLGLRNLRGH